ncbi:MAG: ChaN family lipoprotein [Nitrospiraceae bacterium]
MRHLVLVTCLIVAAPAALVADEPSRPPASPPPSFQEWQVWEVTTGRPVALEPWLAGLASHTIIYVGEEHRNRWHIDAALRILRALTAKGLHPTVALEMFGWDGQDALTRYLSNTPISRDQFLQESHWEESWGGPFEDYEPLVSYAQEHRLTLLALNPPRPLVRLVAKQGLWQAKKDERMEQWGMRNEALSDDAAYRSVVLDQIRRCHAELTDDAYRRMYDASLFRDEGMAKIIAEQVLHTSRAAGGAGPVLAYMGGGHIQYRLPVPNRVARRLGAAGSVSETTIYLTAYEPDRPEAVRQLLQDAIADYVWLTPLSAHGPPRRCK